MPRAHEDRPAVVIDNGAGFVKAGFGGDDAPYAITRSMIGRARYRKSCFSANARSTFVGNNAASRRGILSLSYPTEKGAVVNWDDMEKLLSHTFYDRLHAHPEDHAVLLTETPLNARSNREKMTQVMFETFNTPAMYLANEAVMSLFSTGRATGLVVGCGDDVTYSVPVFDGHALDYAVQRHHVAGRVVTDYLQHLLRRSNASIRDCKEEIVRDMKESFGYVAIDCERERIRCSRAALAATYVLPDGHEITIGDERFRCAEALFDPYLVGLQLPGIHECAFDAAMKCKDEALQKALFGNVVLSGGTTLFPGMADRMRKEVTTLALRDMEVKISAFPERKYHAWIGGSILSSISTLRQMWMTRAEYDEFGPSIVHRKCF